MARETAAVYARYVPLNVRSTPCRPPFAPRRIVEFGDTDMAGIVHFANFFRFMESAEHAYPAVAGPVGGDGDRRRQVRPAAAVSASCDYLRPARFGDELTVKVAVVKLGRSSVSYAFDFTHGDEPIARGRVTAVFCRFDAGRPEACEMPAEFRTKLDPGGESA